MAEEHTSSICGIKKLNGAEDFANWKFVVRNYLESKNWFKVIEATEITAELKDIDRKARTTLCLLLEPACFAHVYSAKTARDVWVSLSEAYEDKGWSRRIKLQRELWQCRLEDCESMEKYISKIICLSQQLADIDAKISDDWMISIILSGLSSYYNPFIMAIDNCGKEIKLEEIKSKLMQEASRENSQNKEQALVTTEQNKKKFDKKKAFIFKCFKCHKEGHKASECKVIKRANPCLSMANTVKKDRWYLDSGCSNHMTNDAGKLLDYKRQQNDLKIKVASGHTMNVIGRGNAIPKVNNNAEFLLTNVYHVPGLSMNLISVSDLVKKDFSVNFDKRGCSIKNKTDQIVATCKEVDGIFELVEKENCVVNLTLSNEVLSNIWHRRLAHLGQKYMNSLKNMVTGLDFKSDDKIEPCVPCINGKTCKSSFKNQGTRAKDLLEIIHSDLCGPMEEPSFSGSRYMLLFIDDYSRKTHVYFLKNKSETLDKFREYKAEVEKQTGKSIKCLRSDNGKEFCNQAFDKILKSAGIKHQKTVPYTPEQNGVAERSNRTIIEKARTLLCEAKLSKKYWAEAVCTVVYLKNRSPTKAVKNKVPEELWSDKKVDLSHLKVFGCQAYALKPKQKQKKFDVKTKELIFIGYSEIIKGYRLIDPKTGEITFSRNVKFLENVFPGDVIDMTKNTVVPIDIEEERIDPVFESGTSDNNIQEEQVFHDAEYINTEAAAVPDETIPTTSGTAEPERRYYLRDRKPVIYNSIAQIDGDPITVEEALARPDSDLWLKAMDEELKSLKENQTWSLVDLPCDKKPIQCKWIFKIKRDSDGKVSKYKARLVAKGFTQVRGVDYNETYSPVVRSSTLRLLFSLAVEYDWHIDQWDVTTAFLYGKLKEDIYMLQPKGAIVQGQETKVCKLQRSLYGLKQASNAWFHELDQEMLNLGFVQSKIEPCLYQKVFSDGNRIIAVIYVDDIFTFYSKNKEAEKQKLKHDLLKRFKIKDLGPARHVLGMRLRRDKNIIYLDQEQYVLNVLKDFDMTDCKPVITPMEVGLKLEKASDSDCKLPYQVLIGCLNYLAQSTRPDIAHAVSVLSQFNSCYDELHFKCAKRVLRYLKGTSNLGLTFKKTGDLELNGYVDADWGGSYDRKSYTGLIFRLGDNIVSWESRKQGCVALSTTEAEYVGLSQASKEAIYLRNLLKSLTKGTCVKPVVIYNDNQSAHKIAKNKMNHNRTKHIDIKFHYIREAIVNGAVEVKYIPSQELLADMLTKSLPGPKLQQFLEKLSIKGANNV